MESDAVRTVASCVEESAEALTMMAKRSDATGGMHHHLAETSARPAKAAGHGSGGVTSFAPHMDKLGDCSA